MGESRIKALQADPIHYHDYKCLMIFMYDQRSGSVCHDIVLKQHCIKESDVSKGFSFKENQTYCLSDWFHGAVTKCNSAHYKETNIIGNFLKLPDNLHSLKEKYYKHGQERWDINGTNICFGVLCYSSTLDLDAIQWGQSPGIHLISTLPCSQLISVSRLQCVGELFWGKDLYKQQTLLANIQTNRSVLLIWLSSFREAGHCKLCDVQIVIIFTLPNQVTRPAEEKKLQEKLTLYEWDTIQLFHLIELKADDTYEPFLNSTLKPIEVDFDQKLELDAEFLEAKKSVVPLLKQGQKEHVFYSEFDETSSELHADLPLDDLEDDEKDSWIDGDSPESSGCHTDDSDEETKDEDKGDETAPKQLYFESNTNYKWSVESNDYIHFMNDTEGFYAIHDQKDNSLLLQKERYSDKKLDDNNYSVRSDLSGIDQDLHDCQNSEDLDCVFKAIDFRNGVGAFPNIHCKNDSEKDYDPESYIDSVKKKEFLHFELDSGYKSESTYSISLSLTSIESTTNVSFSDFSYRLTKKGCIVEDYSSVPEPTDSKSNKSKPGLTATRKRKYPFIDETASQKRKDSFIDESGSEFKSQLNTEFKSLYSNNERDNKQTPLTALTSHRKDENTAEWYFMFIQNTTTGQKVLLYDFHNFSKQPSLALEINYSDCDFLSRQNNETRSSYIHGLLDRWRIFDIDAISIHPVELIACPASTLADYFHLMEDHQNLTIMQTMRFEWMRVRSFWSFPLNAGMCSLQMARNGFFYTGRTSEAQCYSCGQTYKEWTEDDDPDTVHRRISPYCRHLQELDERNVSIYPGITMQWPAVQWMSPPAIGGATGGVEREPETEGGTQTATGGPKTIETGDDVTSGATGGREMSETEEDPTSLEKEEENLTTPKAEDAKTDFIADRSRSETGQPTQATSSEASATTVTGLPVLQLPTTMTAPGSDTSARSANFSAQSQPAESSSLTLPGQPTQTVQRTRPHLGRGSIFTSFTSDPMGINFQRPRYPAYAVLAVRMGTFQSHWPAHLTQTARDMASAGFFSAGNGDYCRCFFCGGGLRNWEPGDDPWVEHARWFPRCVYVIQNKGKRFVELVVQRHQQRNQQQNRERQQAQEQSQQQRQQPQSAQSETTAQYQQPPPQRTHGAGATGARQPPRVDREREELNLPAVISVRDMGYDESKIKSAIQKWKSGQSGQFNTKDMTAMELLSILMEEEEDSSIGGSSPPVVSDEQRSEIAQSSQRRSVTVDHARTNSDEHQTYLVDGTRHDTDISDDAPVGATGHIQEMLSLHRENEELRNQLMCTICGEKPVSVAFLPCGHIVCCLDCAPAMVHCPNCREYVKGTVKAFLQ